MREPNRDDVDLVLKLYDLRRETELRKAHEQLVDDPPWLWIVHDGNPRAMTKQVKGFANAQSWFQDLTLVDLK